MIHYPDECMIDIALREEILSYYTGLDYSEWNRECNMHFGYYRFPMNPFKREAMIEEMNAQVFKHLELKREDRLIYDLGCGLGAGCRSFAKRFPGKKVKGITIVPWQVARANELTSHSEIKSSIELVLGDYTRLPFEDNSADGVYAIESCCHSEGEDKAAFLKEMIRVLKPGKRFVIVDGFTNEVTSSPGSLFRYCYNEICKEWALPSFPKLALVKKQIEQLGGANIVVRDLSYRVAPSVVQAPVIVAYFLMKRLLEGGENNRIRLVHLKACLLGLVLGLHRHRFSYCMITGTKQ